MGNPHGDVLARWAKEETELQLLFDAMEARGNEAGTEAQLDHAGAFLRLAFGLMTPGERRQFLDHPEVVSFVDEQDITED